MVKINLDQEIRVLSQGAIGLLRQRYAEVFGEPPPRTGNKTWLLRRILWRLQALAEGDLSQRAQRQAALLANDADLRLTPPRLSKTTDPSALNTPYDPRLPKPGAVLDRRYKGQLHRVQILADGFAYADSTYRSLSAVAKAITGSHCNGFLFFRLLAKEKSRAQGR
ncbi:MAG: DUF2924 domain-containing protein [Gemmataceae bacterium]